MNRENRSQQFPAGDASANVGLITAEGTPTYQGNTFSQHQQYSAPAPAASGSHFNLMMIIRVLFSQWITVVLMGVLGCLGAVFYILNTESEYRAAAELEMNVRRPKVINNDAIFEDPSQSRDTDVIFNTRFAKFKSPAMEKLAASEYMKKFPDHKQTKNGDVINRRTLAMWTRYASWKKFPDANIVEVAFEGKDPEFAARLVNVLSECAGMLMMQENRAQSDEAVRWLVEQAQEQREVVVEVEKELAALRADIKLDASQRRKLAIDKSLLAVSEEREVLISQLESRKTIFEYILELKKNDANLEMLPPGLPKERELDELIAKWRAANDELLVAADRYTEIHPEYRRMAEIEKRNRKRLDDFITMSARSVQNEVELLSKQIDQIETRMDAMKTEAVELEQALESGLRQVQRLERKRDAADVSYQAVLRRMEEARLSADENMAFAKVIRKAYVPVRPIRPKRGQVLFSGVVLGGFCGCGIAILMAFWTDRIVSVNDLTVLGLNVIATLPSLRKVDSRGQLATVALRDKFNPIVEVFAGINAVISSEKYASRTRLIMMCSVGPGEGKTVSSCNLAVSSAHNGSKTLLIDCDLRRPQLHNIFNLGEDEASLLEWLVENETTDPSSLIVKDVIENLDIISSRPSNEVTPAQLLGREKFSNLLQWARENYDRVIIDSPPLGPVGDAQMIGNLVDGVLIVSRIGETRRRAIKFAIKRFHELDIEVMGCIANAVPHSLAGMFGGADGYGYGYGTYKYSVHNT